MSRIVRKKNLDGALSCLAGVQGDVRLTVYGPTEDKTYWNECQRLMRNLPGNIHAGYGGEVRHEDVVSTLAKHHVLLLPTHGENYGCVICEALTAGCPVIISDQTPWRGLAGAGVGWDISLDNRQGLVGALQECVDMAPDVFDGFSKRARTYAEVHLNDPAPAEQHRQLFRSALAIRMGCQGLNDPAAA
jgi:glycosyltransferase involved in cell wall biosynthesis